MSPLLRTPYYEWTIALMAGLLALQARDLWPILKALAFQF